MENIFWNMNLFVIVTVLSLVKYGVHGGCVADKTATVKPCFDQLKTNMESQNPTDINDFLCGDSQKDRLDCVIKVFNDCPDFKDESFIGDLKHASGFHAKDLFHVSSADEFCKCAPTFTCMEKVETEKLGMDLDEGPWEQIANQEYICGLGRNNIDCVAKSLPTCVDYLQYKHNETVGDNLEGHVDVNSLQYASDYAERQCKNWPDGIGLQEVLAERVRVTGMDTEEDKNPIVKHKSAPPVEENIALYQNISGHRNGEEQKCINEI